MRDPNLRRRIEEALEEIKNLLWGTCTVLPNLPTIVSPSLRQTKGLGC